MIYRFARPLLFALDAEAAHDLTLNHLRRAERFGLTRCLRPRLRDDPVTVMGLRFRNPVGLAPGLDKNAAYIDALGDLGFGFLELGTVTPRAQSGNPKPRMFRLPERDALINRLGFNNLGLQHFTSNVTAARRFRSGGGVIGLNLGKNSDTPNERALDDYCAGLHAVFPLFDKASGYVTINVSSPNTKDLRALHGRAELAALLRGLGDERKRLQDRHGHTVPMALKISPDVENDELPRIADSLVQYGFDAIIATNTTVSRETVSGVAHANEAGGLSGAPLRERANEVTRVLAEHLQGSLPIIGVGGIDSGAAALERLQAGASLIQIYTGLIYHGPELIVDARKAALSRH